MSRLLLEIIVISGTCAHPLSLTMKQVHSELFFMLFCNYELHYFLMKPTQPLRAVFFLICMSKSFQSKFWLDKLSLLIRKVLIGDTQPKLKWAVLDNNLLTYLKFVPQHHKRSRVIIHKSKRLVDSLKGLLLQPPWWSTVVILIFFLIR